MIVVDVNILAFYVIEGKRTRDAHVLKRRDAEWLVPSFWSVEFQSILWKYVRFNGMPMAQALDLFDQAMSLFTPNEFIPSPELVLREALNSEITAYDAQYIALARQFCVRCVTEDSELQKQCPDVAVSLDKFIKSPPGILRESRVVYRAGKRKVK